MNPTIRLGDESRVGALLHFHMKSWSDRVTYVSRGLETTFKLNLEFAMHVNIYHR